MKKGGRERERDGFTCIEREELADGVRTGCGLQPARGEGETAGRFFVEATARRGG